MPTIGTYTTYDSDFLSDIIKGLAAQVEPRNTLTFDLIPELEPVASTYVLWYDAVSYELSGEVGTGGWNSTDTTGLPISSALADIIQIGDALRVADEAVVVSDVDRAGDTISVFSRGFGDTTAAAHLAAVDIYIVGSANVEGTTDQDGLLEENVERKNFMQLVEEKVLITKTGADQEYKDVASKIDEERAKAMTRALKKLNLAVLFGEKDAGSKTAPRGMGGISYWLRTTTGAVNDDMSGSFTESKFKTTLETIMKRGGAPNVVIMSVEQKAVFNDFNNSYIQTGREDRGAGTYIDYYEADGIGRIALVADPRLPDSLGEMFILNTNKLGKMWFKNDMLRFEDEPANSRTIEQTLQGQLTFMMKDIVTDHARIYNI